MQFNIGIIGGGIIGLTSAICVQNKYPNCNVTIITDKLCPHTTADGSAGLWMPYLLQNTPEHKIVKWSKATYDYLYHLWREGLCDVTGVSFLPGIVLMTVNEPYDLPSWLSICHGVHEIPRDQIEKFSREHKRNYRGGFYFTTFTCEPVKLLPYLMQQFLDKGGKIIQRRVNKLDEFISADQNFDIIINCCGLSARDVVPDYKVYAIRGQVARVKAPWLFHTIFSGEEYIIPNQEAVVLGGTHQEHNYSTEVDAEDSKNIFTGCYQLVPGLKTSAVIKEWVGLRPARDCVRLELEIVLPVDNTNTERTTTSTITTITKNTIGISSVEKKVGNRKSLIVIHNYGHGGAGVTLSWGCAIDVSDLVGKALEHLLLSTSSSLSEDGTWQQTYNIRSHL